MFCSSGKWLLPKMKHTFTGHVGDATGVTSAYADAVRATAVNAIPINLVRIFLLPTKRPNPNETSGVILRVTTAKILKKSSRNPQEILNRCRWHNFAYGFR